MNRLLIVSTLALLATASSGSARAGGYVYDPDGRVVQHPDRHLITPPGPVTVVPPPPVTPIPPPRPVTVVPPPPPVSVIEVNVDPYRTEGIVVAGVGFGGVLVRADGRTTLAPTMLLHLGLALDQAEFAVRVDLAPSALELDPAAGGPATGELSLYATRASFNYRFLPGVVVHPVFGAGLEWIAADPRHGPLGHAFAAAFRTGLEFAYPVRSGALALGLDATGHLPFARSETLALDLQAMLGFGAYLDYRF